MSNLLKTSYMNIGDSEKRVIDTNDLVAKRIEDLAALSRANGGSNGGFVSGLMAEEIDPDAIPLSMPEGFGEGEELDEETLAKLMQEREAANAQAAADAEAIIAQANAQAEEILAQANDRAAQITANAQADAEQMKASAVEAGREQGYREGSEQANRELEAQMERMRGEALAMQQEYNDMLSEMEPKLVDAITDIYSHIFRVDMKSRKEILAFLIGRTLERVEDSRSYFVHVGKDSFDYVSSRKQELSDIIAMPGAVLEIVEDMALGDGECMIETDGGIFDCGIDTELSELGAKLRLLSYSRS